MLSSINNLTLPSTFQKCVISISSLTALAGSSKTNFNNINEGRDLGLILKSKEDPLSNC